MNLQNDYKVIFEKVADGERSFYASKTGVFADAELIATVSMGEYKLIYEKAGMIYGSTTGIPAEDDHCFEEFKAVFESAEAEPAEGQDTTPASEGGMSMESAEGFEEDEPAVEPEEVIEDEE